MFRRPATVDRASLKRLKDATTLSALRTAVDALPRECDQAKDELLSALKRIVVPCLRAGLIGPEDDRRLEQVSQAVTYEQLRAALANAGRTADWAIQPRPTTA